MLIEVTIYQIGKVYNKEYQNYLNVEILRNSLVVKGTCFTTNFTTNSP